VEKRSFQTIMLLLVLVAVAVVSFALGKRSGAERQAWLSANATHREVIDYYMTLGREACLRTRLASKARMSVAEFEEHFGFVEPVDQRELPRSRQDATHMYVHKPSHRIFYLRFENDTLVGIASNYGPDDFEPYLPTIEERMARML